MIQWFWENVLWVIIVGGLLLSLCVCAFNRPEPKLRSTQSAGAYKIARMTLKKNEVLVVKCHNRLTMEMASQIRIAAVQAVGPDRRVLVIDSATDISKIAMPKS